MSASLLRPEGNDRLAAPHRPFRPRCCPLALGGESGAPAAELAGLGPGPGSGWGRGSAAVCSGDFWPALSSRGRQCIFSNDTYWCAQETSASPARRSINDHRSRLSGVHRQGPCRQRVLFHFRVGKGREGRGYGELKMTPLIKGLSGEKRINKKLRAINLSHEHVPVTSGLAT